MRYWLLLSLASLLAGSVSADLYLYRQLWQNTAQDNVNLEETRDAISEIERQSAENAAKAKAGLANIEHLYQQMLQHAARDDANLEETREAIALLQEQNELVFNLKGFAPNVTSIFDNVDEILQGEAASTNNRTLELIEKDGPEREIPEM